MEYEPVIGMEVHAQLLTASKMFCGCSADYASAAPNTHTCPICLSMPGVLPTLNGAAIEATVLTGLALHCDIPLFSKFDRKNYLYPDLAKGYQISQYDRPLCQNGWLEIDTNGTTRQIRIRRVHLEEDTAKLLHQEGGSLIDFNRSGIALMEIVTESDIRSADEAWQYLSKLRTILRYLEVSTGNMEEGAMRCEANVSIRPVGTEALGTKVEVKNLNSFRSVRQAIAYEVERQARLLDEGSKVHQVTMGWDENNQRTVFQRSKEQAEDYRYFPDPDLPPVEFSHETIEAIRARLPELPDAKRERFVFEYGLKRTDAAVLVEDRAIANYFEAAASIDGDADPQTVANWMAGELFRLLRESGSNIGEARISPEAFRALLELVVQGKINATVGKDVLAEMYTSGDSAASIVQRQGLEQISGEEPLRELVLETLAQHPKPVQQFLEGKEAVIRFLMGQVMRATRGRANPQIVEQLLRKELEQIREQRADG